jgi:hypothetical protein
MVIMASITDEALDQLKLAKVQNAYAVIKASGRRAHLPTMIVSFFHGQSSHS